MHILTGVGGTWNHSGFHRRFEGERESWQHNWRPRTRNWGFSSAANGWAADGRKTSPVINPATEEVIGQLPHASKADLDRALAEAERGFKMWRAIFPDAARQDPEARGGSDARARRRDRADRDDRIRQVDPRDADRSADVREYFRVVRGRGTPRLRARAAAAGAGHPPGDREGTGRAGGGVCAVEFSASAIPRGKSARRWARDARAS